MIDYKTKILEQTVFKIFISYTIKNNYKIEIFTGDISKMYRNKSLEKLVISTISKNSSHYEKNSNIIKLHKENFRQFLINSGFDRILGANNLPENEKNYFLMTRKYENFIEMINKIMNYTDRPIKSIKDLYESRVLKFKDIK
jgi:hypothetical protein